MMKREIQFVIKGNSYTVSFPTVRNFLNIEASRMTLSNGTYGQLLRSSLITSSVALDMIDMISVMSTLCPKMIEDLKVASMLDLDLADSKEVLDVYNSDIKKWIDAWMVIFKNPKVADQDTK